MVQCCRIPRKQCKQRLVQKCEEADEVIKEVDYKEECQEVVEQICEKHEQQKDGHHHHHHHHHRKEHEHHHRHHILHEVGSTTAPHHRIFQKEIKDSDRSVELMPEEDRPQAELGTFGISSITKNGFFLIFYPV